MERFSWLTDSSSTLAAKGKASLTLKIVVERTIMVL